MPCFNKPHGVSIPCLKSIRFKYSHYCHNCAESIQRLLIAKLNTTVKTVSRRLPLSRFMLSLLLFSFSVYARHPNTRCEVVNNSRSTVLIEQFNWFFVSVVGEFHLRVKFDSLLFILLELAVFWVFKSFSWCNWRILMIFVVAVVVIGAFRWFFVVVLFVAFLRLLLFWRNANISIICYVCCCCCNRNISIDCYANRQPSLIYVDETR